VQEIQGNPAFKPDGMCIVRTSQCGFKYTTYLVYNLYKAQGCFTIHIY